MLTTLEKAAQTVASLKRIESASCLNLSRSTVRRVYQRYQEICAFAIRPRSARTRATTKRDDQFVRLSCLRNRHLTGVQVQQRLHEVREVTLSRRAVRRRLREGSLTLHRPVRGPKLTPAHRQARLRFAREHPNWSLEHWRTVLFSVEYKINLYGNDGCRRVYRRDGEHFALKKGSHLAVACGLCGVAFSMMEILIMFSFLSRN